MVKDGRPDKQVTEKEDLFMKKLKHKKSNQNNPQVGHLLMVTIKYCIKIRITGKEKNRLTFQTHHKNTHKHNIYG